MRALRLRLLNGTPRSLALNKWARSVGVLLLVTVGAACGPGGSPTEPTLNGALGQGTAGRWTTSTPQAQGLDLGILSELETRIESREFGDISSLLVLRNGVMVYELYRDGWTPEDLHRVYSVTKSVTSLAMGIAVDEGVVSDVGFPILDFFPEQSDVTETEAKTAITLEHVLQMRTGWEWDELSTNYTNDANPVADLVSSPDWIRFVLDLPLSETPGTRFEYNSGVSMLMAGVLGNRTGAPAEDFVADRIFRPLSITTWSWDSGPGGLTNSGWGLYLQPRDMAALGQLVLQAGVWEGAEVVPSEWLAQSAVAATRFTDGTGYGYQWWLGPDDGFRQPVAAWGYGGQFIVVIPRLEVVMVSTAENYSGGGFDPYELSGFAYRAAGVALN